MISRRLPASSSFVLAAARLRALQLDPSRTAADRAAARKDPDEQSAQPGGARSHRARFARPLDTSGPYGCRVSSAFDQSLLACKLRHAGAQAVDVPVGRPEGEPGPGAV